MPWRARKPDQVVAKHTKSVPIARLRLLYYRPMGKVLDQPRGQHGWEHDTLPWNNLQENGVTTDGWSACLRNICLVYYPLEADVQVCRAVVARGGGGET